jgi:16S rRNA (guanine527-N7)-methyltransferase
VLTDDPDLRSVLETAQVRGFIGDGDLTPHVEHALGFVAAWEASRPNAVPHHVLDLGSGGGLPGLVLARRWPESRFVLLDASEQRTAFLQEATERLGWTERVRVLRGRAELLAHDEEWRGALDLVVARAFGPPAVVAECAAGFLAVGGMLIVSEPPASSASPAPGDRWDHPEELATLGLTRITDESAPRATAEARPDAGAAVTPLPRAAGSFAVLTCAASCPERYPRRVGIPAKRPLF